MLRVVNALSILIIGSATMLQDVQVYHFEI